MINPNCPLSDKDKLDATLHAECRFQGQLKKGNTYCFDCPYESPTLMRQLEREIFRATTTHFLFEPINDATKRKITAYVSTTLRQYQTRQRIKDYCVICDNTNNLDSNHIQIDVSIKLARSVEFCNMSFKL